MNGRARFLTMVLGTGLAAAMLQLAILRHGIWLTPDSWAYWQGSVSLLHGRGYRFFVDLPINEWPPLFSCYLGAWQWLFGVSGETLRAAMVVSSGVSAALWVVVLAMTLRGGRVTIWVGVFLAVMFAQAARHLMSESLSNVLLPVLVGLTITATDAKTRRRFAWSAAGAGVVGGLLLLTRNSCAAFLCATMLLLVCNRKHGLSTRLGMCALFVAIAVLPTVISESILPKAWAQPLGLGNGKYTPLDYLFQMARGLGDRLAPAPAGVLVWLAVVAAGTSRLVPDPPRARVRACVLFCVTATAALYVMFNLTHVFAQFKGRFLFFVPLVTGAAVLTIAPTLASTRVRVALLVAILGLPVGTAVKYAIKGRAPAPTASDAQVLESHFIRPHFTIDPNHVDLPPHERSDGTLVVAPPLFSDLKARLGAK